MKEKNEITCGFWLFSTVHNKPDTASSRIRGEWLINYWEGAEELKYGKKYDAVIYQKVYEVEHAKIYDGVKILDICDPDYLDCKIPVKQMMDLCDLVTVSTENLGGVLKKFTETPIMVIPDRHDLNYFKQKKIHKGRAKEVCWYGYSHNVKPLASVKEYLKKYNLGLSIIANEPVMISDQGSDIIIKERFTKWDIETVNDEIIKSDFVVLPGSRDPNFKFKSNNKIINAYLLGMPVAICVEELERYLDPKNRQEDADKNYEIARKEYNIEINIKIYKDLIEKIMKEKNAIIRH